MMTYFFVRFISANKLAVEIFVPQKHNPEATSSFIQSPINRENLGALECNKKKNEARWK